MRVTVLLFACVSVFVPGIAEAGAGTRVAPYTRVAPPRRVLAAGSLGSFKEERPLVSGVPAVVGLPAVPPPNCAIFDNDQFTIEVPAGSVNLWIELFAAETTDDFDFYVRFGQPVVLTPEGSLLADWGSFTTGWYEELGLWGAELQIGTYYIALVSCDADGGDLTLTATVDGAVVDLTSGTPVNCRVPADDTNAEDFNVFLDGQQFRFPIPAGATSLYVRFQATELASDTVLALRYGKPCESAGDGSLLFDFTLDFADGFDEHCITAADTIPEFGTLFRPGEDIYLWVLNDAGGGRLVEGSLLVAADGCTKPLALGPAADDVARATTEAGITLLAARQFVVTVAEPLAELKLTLTPTGDPADLDFYVRKGTPIAVEGDQVVADFTAAATGTDPEQLTISCEAIAAGTYYLVVGNPNRTPIPYTILAEAGTACAAPEPQFRRGDVNGDGQLNIADAVALLGHLFGGTGPLKCFDAADANDEGAINIADAIKILGHLFAGEGPLALPFGTPGPDPTVDVLTCGCYPAAECK